MRTDFINLLGGIAILLTSSVGVCFALPANEALQQVLDRQYSWINSIENMSTTVSSTFLANNSPTMSTGTVTIDGEKFRLDSVTMHRGKGGSIERRPVTLLWNGETFIRIDPASLEASVGDLPTSPEYAHNPYGAFQMPYLQYSWVTVGNKGHNSLSGLQDQALWQADKLPAISVTDQETSVGLQRTVKFQWDHGSEVPYLVQNDMVFSEPHNFMAIGYTTLLIDKETSAARIGSIGSFDQWTTVSVGDGKPGIALPMVYKSHAFDEAGNLVQSHELHSDPGALKINQGVSPSAFEVPVIPHNYRVTEAVTGKILTTDTEVLQAWNEKFTLKSCLECAETTSVENLPSGDLTVEVQLTGTGSQTLEGRAYKVFYRYGNCCVMYKEGILDNKALIRLEQVPGKADKFEYPIYVDSVLVVTLEPQASKKVAVQVAPLTDQLAPDIALTDMFTSETTTLSRFSGKRIVLDFWGIDCAPCRPALIKLNNIASSTSATSTLFFSAAGRIGNLSKTTDFINDNQLTSIRHFWVPNTAYEYVGNDGIPLTVLIDETGRIVWRGNPGDSNFEEIVSAFMK